MSFKLGVVPPNPEPVVIDSVTEKMLDEQSSALLEALTAPELIWLMAKLGYEHIPDTWSYWDPEAQIKIDFNLIDPAHITDPDQFAHLLCLCATNLEIAQQTLAVLEEKLRRKTSAEDCQIYKNILDTQNRLLSQTKVQSTFPTAISSLDQPILAEEEIQRIEALLLPGGNRDPEQEKNLFLALHLLPAWKPTEKINFLPSHLFPTITVDNPFSLNEAGTELLNYVLQSQERIEYLKKSLTVSLGQSGRLAELILVIQQSYQNALTIEGADASGDAGLNVKKWFVMTLWSGEIGRDFYDRDVINEEYNRYNSLQRSDGFQFGSNLQASIEMIRQSPTLFQLIQSAVLPDAIKKTLLPYQEQMIRSWCKQLSPDILIRLYVRLKAGEKAAKLLTAGMSLPNELERLPYEKLITAIKLSPEQSQFTLHCIERMIADRYPASLEKLNKMQAMCKTLAKNHLKIMIDSLNFSNLRWLSLVCQDQSADFRKQLVKSLVIRPDAELDLGRTSETHSSQSRQSQIVRQILPQYQSNTSASTAESSVEMDRHAAAMRALHQHFLTRKAKCAVQTRNVKGCLEILLRNPDLFEMALSHIHSRLDEVHHIDLQAMRLMKLAHYYDKNNTLPSLANRDEDIAPLIAMTLARDLPMTWRQWMVNMCKCVDFSSRPDLKFDTLPKDLLTVVGLRLRWPSVREKLHALFYHAEDHIEHKPSFPKDEGIYLPSETVLFDQPDFPVEFNQTMAPSEFKILVEAIRNNPSLTILDFGLISLPKDIDELVKVLAHHPHLKIIHSGKDALRLIEQLLLEIHKEPDIKSEKIDRLIFSILSHCHQQYDSELIPAILRGELTLPEVMTTEERQLLSWLQALMQIDPLAALKVEWYCSMQSCAAVKQSLVAHGVSPDIESIGLEQVLEKELVMHELQQRHPPEMQAGESRSSPSPAR